MLSKYSTVPEKQPLCLLYRKRMNLSFIKYVKYATAILILNNKYYTNHFCTLKRYVFDFCIKSLKLLEVLGSTFCKFAIRNYVY